MTEPTESELPSVTAGSEGGDGSARYVYGVIRCGERRRFGDIGMGGAGERVYTVHYRDLAAVVSSTADLVYDPTRENVMTHELVNETVMQEFTVLPMAFGTIFRAEEGIVELLRSTYGALDDALERMQDKVELGLQVLWDRDRVARRLEGENEEIGGLKAKVTGEARGSSYLARMQLGRLLEAALEEAATEYVLDVHQSLKPFAIASRSSKVIGDRMILNAAYLVERSGEEAFDEAVRSLSRKHEGDLSFRYGGPWPPYSFVNIKLKLDRAGP
jgi:hypothetical protein